jgi:uncharacterized protein (TIGR03435 family)
MAIGGVQAQSPDGGKMAFEVASVKPSKVFKPPNFPLDGGDAKTAGGRLSASFPLVAYISFAYKLSASGMGAPAFDQLSKSIGTDLFEIEARGAGDPTKTKCA